MSNVNQLEIASEKIKKVTFRNVAGEDRPLSVLPDFAAAYVRHDCSLVELAFGLGLSVNDGIKRRTVVGFCGDAYCNWLDNGQTDDPVLRAFIDPKSGALDMQKLAKAAMLLLATVES